MHTFSIAEPSEPILADPCGLNQPFIHPNFESGYITSPNYPESYPNSANCSWLIQTHTSYSLELQFIDIDLEPRYEIKTLHYHSKVDRRQNFTLLSVSQKVL